MTAPPRSLPAGEGAATPILPFDDHAVAQAARLILSGQPVAIATETVYGLAADATNGAGVARIYAAKGRPAFNPLIVHAGSRREAAGIARFDAAADALAAAFWPGPLTLVLPLAANAAIAPIVTAGLPTVALRVPAHAAMRALLAACGRPLAAPSANASGTISPTTAAHVARSLDGRVPLIVDAGPTAHGLESTIVAVEAERLVLLRPGPIAADALARAAGLPIVAHQGTAIVAPGQLASHYAPRQPVRLEATGAAADEWLIGFGAVAGDATLSAAGDPIEAAARLFAALHEADASGRARIAVAPVPNAGLGAAINDRLRRAAAPR
ncbi:L-threonylcarbamoyladenylate synthase [Sphingomonas profundi]|uniref:L-threonylcarbamoyladenylate synthase n=1 Tax=Alterirhizorhabdus profundi TaxID=2681549 RepID=UPI0012E717D7|nr:L-threonylcarbamoyladenylate synthase [Sphingomonas profundi]